MFFSIYTPTNNPEWLVDTYNSLMGQTFTNWEWIIVPNGENINDIINKLENYPWTKDFRVKIYPTDLKGIGALKKFCCEKASGDIFVELDHDDMLLPECLNEINKAKDITPDGFYYSDAISYFPDHTSEVYNMSYGWESYPVRWNDRFYTVMKSFDVTPRSLCEIFFAPNHVRAWSRKAYIKSGGYDESLAVGDDHDLLCRTYLTGVKFHFIKKCLYIYRRHGNNTCFVDNKKVIEQQFKNKNKYLHSLIFEWCKRENKLMIDLGGAHNCPRQHGFMSLDIRNIPGVDIVADIMSKDCPLEKNSVGCFRASDFLEHIPPITTVTLMNKLYDYLCHEGWMISATPSIVGPDGRVGLGAFQDPTHVSVWSENNFWYFTNKDYAKYVPEISCRFQSVRVWTDYPTEWNRKNSIPYVFADLMAIKGNERVAGQCFI